MGIQEIIILIGVLIGVLLFNKTKPNSLKLILIGLIFSVVLPFLSPKPLIINISYWIFGIMTILTSIYFAINRKYQEFLIGFFAFLSFLFGLMHWSYYNELLLSMIIPLIFYIMILRDWKKNMNQISILTILGFYELSLIVKYIGIWVD